MSPSDVGGGAAAEAANKSAKAIETRDAVVVRFAGDSGDGMQLVGTQFTIESALAGNDLGTLPDFPAEIRAPAGSLAGVSGFQLNFSSREVFTPGDSCDVLVAMNPAALKVNIEDGSLKPGGMLIVDKETFTDQNLRKAEYQENPLTNGSLDGFQLFAVDISKLTTTALQDSGLSNKQVLRCKNFLALGLMSWLFQRPIEPTVRWIEQKFKKAPELLEANKKVLQAGYNFGETAELFHTAYEVRPAKIAPGRYRNVTGNAATSLGLVAAAQRSGQSLFLGSYPITPASDILHELSSYKQFGIRTFQAEDEIAAVGAALGAAFGGAIGVTTTSGPGVCLKSEAIGLAVAVELPLVIVDVQRGSPSTGLPTKTEQADLMLAMYGRHGECPLPILASATPADCFATVFEAVRLAVRYMTPVIFLSDGYIANGAEPWLVPRAADLPEIKIEFRTDPEGYQPYLRDAETLARPWVIPGTPGLEHRIGGLEREDVTGNVSYHPMNHEHMVRTRARKIAGIAREIPPSVIEGAQEGDVLVVGWGSTYGSISAAVKDLVAAGKSVGHLHVRHLNPLPTDLGDIFKRFRRVLVPEMNLGQLVRLLRAEFLVDAVSFTKVQGRPFKVSEIASSVQKLLEESK